MNDTKVVPYADFLERRERQRRIAAELRKKDSEPTVGAQTTATPARPLRSSEVRLFGTRSQLDRAAE